MMVVGVLAWGLAGSLPGCAGSPVGVRESLVRASDAGASGVARAEALARADAGAGEDAALRIEVRESARRLAWDRAAPGEVRVRALERLLADEDPSVRDEARLMGRLRLATETRRAVVEFLANRAARDGWAEYVPALVRSLANPWREVDDASRPEKRALEALNPGRSLESTLFFVFDHPPEEGTTRGVDWGERTQAGAWDVLDRLDPNGVKRREFLERGGESGASRALASCLNDLRAWPRTGEELRWALALSRAEHVTWWGEARRAASQGLAPGQVHRVAHAEPMRWAMAHRPGWLQASREDLLSLLGSRLAGRRVYPRRSEDAVVDERLEAGAGRLSKSDLLALLVIDEALGDPLVMGDLLEQARLDRDDASTEYGGVLRSAADGGLGARFFAKAYPPRPAQRQGDERFIASEEMIRGSDLALAHYHFHVQKDRNESFAGPSRGDLEYAARLGRICVMVTSVGAGVFDVDVYTPEGVVVDLGEIPRPQGAFGGQSGMGGGNKADGGR